MTTRKRRRDDGYYSVSTLSCPLCGDTLKEQQSLAKHLRHACDEN